MVVSLACIYARQAEETVPVLGLNDSGYPGVLWAGRQRKDGLTQGKTGVSFLDKVLPRKPMFSYSLLS